VARDLRTRSLARNNAALAMSAYPCARGFISVKSRVVARPIFAATSGGNAAPAMLVSPARDAVDANAVLAELYR
jgi:hypothetical protein